MYLVSLISSLSDSFKLHSGAAFICNFCSNHLEYVCLFLQTQYDGVQPEIQDMETLRVQLHQLLALSEHDIPGLIHSVVTMC